MSEINQDDYLTATQVARLFGVDPKTVTRWARAGKIDHILTVGGHRRYPRSTVMRLLGRNSE